MKCQQNQEKQQKAKKIRIKLEELKWGELQSQSKQPQNKWDEWIWWNLIKSDEVNEAEAWEGLQRGAMSQPPVGGWGG